MQAGAGMKSGITDADYQAAGAVIAPDAAARSPAPTSCLRVKRPAGHEVEGAKPGAAVIAIMDPYGNNDAIADLGRRGVTAFAMELMPRITRAQVMDVLSSQANLAGYRAVIDGAAEYGRAIPMMMTAAGTIPAAQDLHHGRRRRRPAGDRHRAAAWRDRHRD